MICIRRLKDESAKTLCYYVEYEENIQLSEYFWEKCFYELIKAGYHCEWNSKFN